MGPHSDHQNSPPPSSPGDNIDYNDVIQYASGAASADHPPQSSRSPFGSPTTEESAAALVAGRCATKSAAEHAATDILPPLPSADEAAAVPHSTSPTPTVSDANRSAATVAATDAPGDSTAAGKDMDIEGTLRMGDLSAITALPTAMTAERIGSYRIPDDEAEWAGGTALHVIARRGLGECVPGLLGVAGIEIGARDGQDRTALDVAMMHMDPDAPFETGARHVATSHTGVMALLAAAVAAGDDASCVSEWSLTLAVRTKSVAVLEAVGRYFALCQYGLNARPPSVHYMPPLIEAARRGATDMVEYLIDEMGAKVDALAHDGLTALMWASWTAHDVAVRSLLARGADVGMTNTYGGKAVHYGAKANSVRVMRALIEAGADVEAVVQGGIRPLRIACQWESVKCVRFLVEECGVDVAAVDDDGHTAAWWCEHSNDDEEAKAEMMAILSAATVGGPGVP